jgi:hypothetical protein
MLFMSAEHVATMNDLLAASAEVAAATQALDRQYLIVYELDRDGRLERWSVTLGPGELRFGLGEAGQPDLRLTGDWRRAVAASRLAREGQASDPGLAMEGDIGVLERLAPILAAAQSVATVAVEWPDTA